MNRFSKILIANRGEIASRIIRTTKQMGIKSLAVFNQFDTHANYVHEADEAISISGSNSIFVDAHQLVSIAKQYGADAIHPGYGFISENPEFSKCCYENGIKFIGPSFSTMQLLSSKKDAKDLAILAGIPVVPGFNGKDQTTSRLIEEIQKIGYPVLLKATMGGGGRGMRVLNDDTNIQQVIEMCRNEAKSHFGDDSLIIEKFIPRTRHIEIQAFGDREGNVVHFGERECSLQRNYQKVIEEAPCFYLSNEERDQLYHWATQIIHDSHYEGAGTVEFLCDATTRQFYFMEVNTRLQVEHLVSQCINSQIDLVELQIRIAQGETIPSMGIQNYIPPFIKPSHQQSAQMPSIYKKGNHCGKFSMECRVYNEDPKNHFLPGDGVCVFKNHTQDSEHTLIENNITPVKEGDHVVAFDPMLLKVVITGESRLEVIERMEQALRRCNIFGIPTNIQFLVNALRMKKFREYGADSQTIAEEKDALLKDIELTPFEMCNSIASYVFHTKKLNHLNPWDHLGNFCNTGSLKREEYLILNEKPVVFSIESDSLNPNLFQLNLKGDTQWEQAIPVEFVGKMEDELTLKVHNQLVKSYVYEDASHTIHIFPVTSTEQFNDVHYTVDMDDSFGMKESTSVQSDEMCDILCPMPSTISRVSVKNGDRVKKGDVLLVIEAMKMEHIITAPHDGVVEMSQLEEKQFIKKGQTMLRVV